MSHCVRTVRYVNSWHQSPTTKKRKSRQHTRVISTTTSMKSISASVKGFSLTSYKSTSRSTMTMMNNPSTSRQQMMKKTPWTYIASTRNVAVTHALTATLSNDTRYSNNFFYGWMIDTGCARASGGGLSQCRAYFRYECHPENIASSKKMFCKFGIGGKTSIGRVTIQFLIKGIFLEF